MDKCSTGEISDGGGGLVDSPVGLKDGISHEIKKSETKKKGTVRSYASLIQSNKCERFLITNEHGFTLSPFFSFMVFFILVFRFLSLVVRFFPLQCLLPHQHQQALPPRLTRFDHFNRLLPIVILHQKISARAKKNSKRTYRLIL